MVRIDAQGNGERDTSFLRGCHVARRACASESVRFRERLCELASYILQADNGVCRPASPTALMEREEEEEE